MNELFAKAYYLEESLKEIWQQLTKQKAEEVLDDWASKGKRNQTIGQDGKYYHGIPNWNIVML